MCAHVHDARDRDRTGGQGAIACQHRRQARDRVQIETRTCVCVRATALLVDGVVCIALRGIVNVCAQITDKPSAAAEPVLHQGWLQKQVMR
jgi:hypothetical protein